MVCAYQKGCWYIIELPVFMETIFISFPFKCCKYCFQAELKVEFAKFSQPFANQDPLLFFKWTTLVHEDLALLEFFPRYSNIFLTISQYRLFHTSGIDPAVFKNVAERSATKHYCPVNLLSMVSKVFKNW